MTRLIQESKYQSEKTIFVECRVRLKMRLHIRFKFEMEKK